MYIFFVCLFGIFLYFFFITAFFSTFNNLPPIHRPYMAVNESKLFKYSCLWPLSLILLLIGRGSRVYCLLFIGNALSLIFVPYFLGIFLAASIYFFWPIWYLSVIVFIASIILAIIGFNIRGFASESIMGKEAYDNYCKFEDMKADLNKFSGI